MQTDNPGAPWNNLITILTYTSAEQDSFSNNPLVEGDALTLANVVDPLLEEHLNDAAWDDDFKKDLVYEYRETWVVGTSYDRKAVHRAWLAMCEFQKNNDEVRLSDVRRVVWESLNASP